MDGTTAHPTEPLAEGLPRAVWGKASAASFHPLLFHLLDVGAVARALVERACSPRWSERVLQGLSSRTIGLLAGLHDLGKASPAFQLKRRDLLSSWRDEFSWPSSFLPADDVPHGTVGAAVLQDVLAHRFHLPRPTAQRVADALAGHHGHFAEPDEVDAAKQGGRRIRSGFGKRDWSRLRSRLVDELCVQFGAGPSSWPELDTTQAYVLAGLVSVADWLGSNEAWFGYRPTATLEDYRRCCQDRAATALTEVGFLRWEPRPAPFTVRFGLAPRALQQVTETLGRAVARRGGPVIVVVEAEMGSGKTEAAFDLAAELVAGGLASGVYVALPTRATANQMFTRATDFLTRNTASPQAVAHLVHGLAPLDAHFAAMLKRPARTTVSPSSVFDDPGTQVRADEWFTTARRGLLAPWGIGTVDALLMAALRVRHGAVRMFALSDKVVVVDEVHAYDVYMSTLLDRLLQWLGALGVSVIVLSATLPAARRRQLLEAWAGRPVATGDGYPLVSWATHDDEGSQTAPATRTATVRVELRPGVTEPADISELLAGAIRDGGCAAMVCNTVGRAQQIYRELRRRVRADGVEVTLLHSRFPHDERVEREHHVIEQFGPNGRRPARAVLIATQVIEQSLDLDFDVLVSDLAPVDLLLQRMGRLHRHDRARPATHATPTLIVVGWARPTAAQVSFPAGSTAVYGEYLLARTAAVLTGRTSISVPADLPTLVEAVYSDGPVPDAQLTAQIDRARQVFELRRNHERDEARARFLPDPHDTLASLAEVTRHAGAEEQPDLHPRLQALTRLGLSSIDAVLLTRAHDRIVVPPGGRAVSPDAAPDRELTRQLLGRSVNLTHPGVVDTLRQAPAPPGWQQCPWLRHHRMIVADETGRCVIGPWAVTVDPELGVVIERSTPQEP